jgi:signal transduction histidine kinase
MYGRVGTVSASSRAGGTGKPVRIAALARTAAAALVPSGAVLLASVAGRRLGLFGFVEAAMAALALLATVLAAQRLRERAALSEHIDLAVTCERRRIARDIHDGLAQDLAFVAARVRMLEHDPTASVRLDHLASAAHRALDHSRTAIATLTRPLDEPLDTAISRTASELAERHGGHADLRLQPGIVVAPSTRESLIRIVREAVTNAMRHGRAARVDVSLSQDVVLRLCIADDGCGFEAGAPAGHRGAGFGLLSMAERAGALGGRFAIRSAPGSGTTIVVELPWPTA